MWLRRMLAGLLVVAAACGGETGADAGRGDYATQLARVSGNAHIQERGLAHDLEARLEKAGGRDQRLTALIVFADQSARLYQDVVDALGELDPPQEVSAAQDDYVAAWQAQLDLIIKVRDASFHWPGPFIDSLEAPAFHRAAVETRTRCEQLQGVVQAGDPGIDLVCDGKP